VIVAVPWHDKIIGGQKSLVALALAASRIRFENGETDRNKLKWIAIDKEAPHALRTVTDRHKKEPTKDLGTDVSILSSRQ